MGQRFHHKLTITLDACKSCWSKWEKQLAHGTVMSMDLRFIAGRGYVTQFSNPSLFQPRHFSAKCRCKGGLKGHFKIVGFKGILQEGIKSECVGNNEVFPEAQLQVHITNSERRKILSLS